MTVSFPGRRVRAAVVLATCLALSSTGLAAAHAELVRANPADGETVARPVTAVTGRFSEGLVDGSRLVVKDASGATVGTGDIDPEDDRRLIARIAPALREGAFTVESTARSADGHVERATWRFVVVLPSSPPMTVAPSASESPSAGPSATAAPSPSPSPTASPTPAEPTSGTSDVLLPILAALAIVAVGAGALLSRGRSARR